MLTRGVRSILDLTYQSKCSHTDTSNRSASHQHTIVDSRRLQNSSNIEYNDHYNKGSLSGYLVGQPGHKEASQKGTQLQHTSHETLAEASGRERIYFMELVHDIDDGDDTLIVAKGETAQRRHKRSKQDVGGADDAPYTTGSICDILGDLGGKIFGLDGGQVGKLSMFVLIFRPSRTGINCYRRHIDDLESNAQSGDDTRGNGESSC